MNKKRARYAATLGIVTGMVAAAELLGEREIVFPEIAALASGMWVIDKQVWRIGRRQTVWMMTLAATVGWLLARCPGMPAAGGIALGFLFAAALQVATRTTLAPLLSACLLPTVLGADSAVYPAAVLVLTLALAAGQRLMERCGLRAPLAPVFRLPSRRREVAVWLRLFVVLMGLVALPLAAGCRYCILPPLLVAFVEFARPGAGLHKATGTIFGLLAAGAVLGAGCRYALCTLGGMPLAAAALAACAGLFVLFERRGRIFAPAAAVALVPLLIPESDLALYPVQVSAGAAVFLAAGRILAGYGRAAASAEQAAKP